MLPAEFPVSLGEVRRFSPILGLVLVVSLSADEAQSGSPTSGKAVPESALEIFHQLGLPDTRGATWVQANGENVGSAILPDHPGGGYSGNAWLIREEADGTVELVMHQCHRILGRRAKENDAEESRTPAPGDLPEFRITAADLDKDMKALAGTIGGGEAVEPSHEDEHLVSLDDSRELRPFAAAPS